MVLGLAGLLALAAGCRGEGAGDDDASDDDASGDDDTSDGGIPTLADVVAVAVSGDPGEYVFSVTVHSPDTGCEQYADWWEVLDPGGTLLFRRILQHSHVDEQPFTRGGEPVPAQPADEVIVRAHMNELGYGGQAMRGTAAGAFAPAPDIDATFAPGVETQEPLPEDCLW